jgi:hypothetical protein
MTIFDTWLRQHGLLKGNDRTIFEASIPDETPGWICMWILDECVLPYELSKHVYLNTRSQM